MRDFLALFGVLAISSCLLGGLGYGAQSLYNAGYDAGAHDVERDQVFKLIRERDAWRTAANSFAQKQKCRDATYVNWNEVFDLSSDGQEHHYRAVWTADGVTGLVLVSRDEAKSRPTR